MLGVVTPAELEQPDGTVAIAVERDANRLRLTIELADPVRDRQTEIVRTATQALRDFDRRSAVIDVAIRNPAVRQRVEYAPHTGVRAQPL